MYIQVISSSMPSTFSHVSPSSKLIVTEASCFLIKVLESSKLNISNESCAIVFVTLGVNSSALIKGMRSKAQRE